MSRRANKLKYPVGFVSTREWHRIKWRSWVEEDVHPAGGAEGEGAGAKADGRAEHRHPVFIVASDDGRLGPFRSSVSPSDAWRLVAAAVARDSAVDDMDGVAMFGFDLTRKCVKKWHKALRQHGGGVE